MDAVAAVTQQVKCALCERTEVSPRLSMNGISVGICGFCHSGMVTALPGRSTAENAEDYSQRYERERLSDKPAACWQLLDSRLGNLKELNSILDIGCGEGGFLSIAKQAGLKTVGMDISASAITVVQSRGHRGIQASIEHQAGGEYFDLCVMWDLLEHLEPPGRALENVFTSLAPGGRVFIVTPMMGSVYDRLGLFLYDLTFGRVQNLLRMCWTRDHLFRFHPQALDTVLRAHGFVDISIEPLMLLSLSPSRYAGGEVMGRWTPFAFLNRAISFLGVSAARLCGFHNKIFVEARRPLQ